MSIPLPLPRPLHKDPDATDTPVIRLQKGSQLTLIGGSGAGKSRFMDELQRLNASRSFRLSAIGADYPSRPGADSGAEGSIDAIFREAAARQSYMRTDAVSQIDKLIYMLFCDEFDELIRIKSDVLAGQSPGLHPTRLDRLQTLWERLFPGNRIVRIPGKLMFATGAGDDLIDASHLSQGEKTVLYYIAGTLYAMENAVIFIDSPSLFIHPSQLNAVWNAIEQLRPDCTFVYDSVDEDFAGSRTRNMCIWIKSYDSDARAWDYEIIPGGEYREDLFLNLIGSRKPVLFVEGDAAHSIDFKLYTLVFPEYTVRPLGSCDKVIETTRSFNDLRAMHHLNALGIVDRDRRTDAEVEYLRRKHILVPEVAEVENIFLLEEVVRTMAMVRGKDPRTVMSRVRRGVGKMFHARYTEQALQHVRHRVKREVECKIDARFTCITAMESHIAQLATRLHPREQYERLLADFHRMSVTDDYASILKVFNHKPMLGECGVAQLLGYTTKETYIAGVLSTLKGEGKPAHLLRESIRYCLRAADGDNTPQRESAQKHDTIPPAENDKGGKRVLYKGIGSERHPHKKKKKTDRSR